MHISLSTDENCKNIHGILCALPRGDFCRMQKFNYKKSDKIHIFCVNISETEVSKVSWMRGNTKKGLQNECLPSTGWRDPY